MNWKKILLLIFVCAVFVFTAVSVGRTNYKSYYSGDAVSYRGDLIIASTDSGSLELFKLDNSGLERYLKFRAPNSPLDKTDDFSSVKLNIEGDRLFAYATSAYTLYKYDLSDLAKPVLFAKQKNTYYEWYKRVDKFGQYIVTVSDKNVRLWKIDTNTLDVVDSYKIENDLASSVRFDASGRYITNINKDNQATIYDTNTRSVVSSFPVNYRGNQNLRKTYFDPIAKELYVFDDYYLKRFALNGELIVSYPNSSTSGYSVEPSGDYNYVYVVNGDSVMKLAKDNLKSGLKISAYRLNLNAYAMDIKYVNTDSGERVVVFNGGGVSVLNSSLNIIASIEATEIPEQAEIKEALALAFDNYSATPSATVTLSGAGYLPGEILTINFGGSITKVNADANGRFSQKIIVPDSPQSAIDAKVDGADSKLTYSISFKVFKIK